MSKTYTPLRYPGGKSQFYNQVVEILQSNNITNSTYIEPFAGGAGVGLKLLFKGLVDKIIINDIDRALYAFWYTVLNDNEWLVDQITSTDITIEEWKKQRHVYYHQERYSLRELGFATLFLNRCNRSGILRAGPIGGKKQLGNYKIDCRFNKKSLIGLIVKISTYKDKIVIYNLDASKLIKKMKNKDGLFWFIDPPYYIKGSELYKNSFSALDHKRLSKTINRNLFNHTWILTYDIHQEIFNLYKSFNYKIINLSYSVESKRKENEYLFYNNLIIKNESCFEEYQ